MANIFFLGVGAQKAGTTWLYKYLSSQPKANFGPLKEYHIWDAQHLDSKFWLAKPEDELRYELQNIDGAYENYFSSLMNSDTSFTGDITPSYAGLPEECFELIKKKLEAVGFKIKVIFLMRDPFERCWSAVRMKYRNNMKVSGDAESLISEKEALQNLYKTEEFVMRTDYKKTIESLEAVFLKKEIYYGIYEEMFQIEKIRALADFCNLPFDPEKRLKKVNITTKKNYEGDVLKKEIRQYYQSTYEFCYERFPQTKILWANEKNQNAL
jgi:hypothetical protein